LERSGQQLFCFLPFSGFNEMICSFPQNHSTAFRPFPYHLTATETSIRIGLYKPIPHSQEEIMETDPNRTAEYNAADKAKQALHHLVPGMRIIKTAIAVFLCLTLDFLRATPYPIQSSVAAVICLQPDIRSSRVIAGNRVIGTFAAGIYSYLFMLLFVEKFRIDPAGYLFYCLVAAGIIPLILIVLMLKRPGSVIITSVVFLIICLTKGQEDTLIYAIDRVIDTLLGITFALLVNWFPLLNRHRSDTTENNPE